MYLAKQTNVQVLKDHPSIIRNDGLLILLKVNTQWINVFVNGVRWDSTSPIELQFDHNRVNFEESDLKEFYILP